MHNIRQVLSSQDIRSVTDFYPEYFSHDFETWIEDCRNVAYKSGDNISFCEFKSPGHYWVHLCCHTARGREALDLVNAMLRRFYGDRKFASAVGLISDDNVKAKWFIRKLGFVSLGSVETVVSGECEMFYLSGDSLLTSLKEGRHRGV